MLVQYAIQQVLQLAEAGKICNMKKIILYTLVIFLNNGCYSQTKLTKSEKQLFNEFLKDSILLKSKIIERDNAIIQDQIDKIKLFEGCNNCLELIADSLIPITIKKTITQNVMPKQNQVILSKKYLEPNNLVTDKQLNKIKEKSVLKHQLLFDSLSTFIVGNLRSGKYFLDTADRNYSIATKDQILNLQSRFKEQNGPYGNIFLNLFRFSQFLFWNNNKECIFTIRLIAEYRTYFVRKENGEWKIIQLFQNPIKLSDY